MFIFDRCHCSRAAGTHVKYECDSKYVIYTLAQSIVPIMEKLMKGALVAPPQNQTTVGIISVSSMHHELLMRYWLQSCTLWTQYVMFTMMIYIIYMIYIKHAVIVQFEPNVLRSCLDRISVSWNLHLSLRLILLYNHLRINLLCPNINAFQWKEKSIIAENSVSNYLTHIGGFFLFFLFQILWNS